MFPAATTDEELLAVAAYRSKGRLPILCWKQPCLSLPETPSKLADKTQRPPRLTRLTPALLRSSQPLASWGPGSRRCQEDENYIQYAAQANEMTRSLVIADCRPSVNAHANSAVRRNFVFLSQSRDSGCI
jgi:myotubularin-related protein 1/2